MSIEATAGNVSTATAGRDFPPALAARFWRRSDMEVRLKAVTKDKLMEDLKVVAHDLEQLLKATANQAGENIAAVRARAQESLHDAQSHLLDVGEEAAARTRAAASAADDYVHDNPWQAVCIAAGVAFVIGMLVGRR